MKRSTDVATAARVVVLRDGTLGTIRELVAGDRDALLALHEGLSPRTLYLRFFSASRLSAGRYVTRLVRPGTGDHGGVVLEVHGRLVGVAAYESIAGDHAPVAGHGLAECAFVVADDQHGRGIGTLLLEHLAALARRRSVTQFVAETLPENAVMLDVFKVAGYAVTFRRSLDTVQVSIDLTPGPNVLTALDRREREATCANLAPLLRPRSVAVVGAVPQRRSLGGAVLHNILQAGFAGPVYPVAYRAATKARRGSIQGQPSFARLADVPEPVDLIVVAVPAPAVLDVIDDCAAVEAKAVIVLSPGFADVGPQGAALQDELRERARKVGVRLVGPNCLGVTSTAPGVSLAATSARHLPLPGRVGILTQSGGLGVALLAHTRQAGIGLSSFVSVGNKADVSANDLLSWWDDDPATDLVVLYLESFGNPRKFARLARHVSTHKPVVAIRAGRTGAGARPGESHTAAAPARSVAALFRQAGVINVDHMGELIDVVTFLSTQPLPAGPRIAIVSNTGGPGALAADAAWELGLAVPAVSSDTQARLRSVLPPGAGVSNPVNTISSANGAQFAAAASLLLDDPAIDVLLAIIMPTPMTPRTELVDALSQAVVAGPKPVVVTQVGADSRTGLLGTGGRRPIPVFAFPETAIRAVARAHEYKRFRDRPTGTVPVFPDVRPGDAKAVIARALMDEPEGGWLDPTRVEALLAAYGIACLPSRLVTTPSAAAKAAARLGLPVVVKAVGPDLVHKSDIGGVVLGLDTADAVRKAVQRMKATIGARMTGALIQPMAAPGVETMVGVTADPSFGPLVTFGMGGIYAELIADQAFRLVPLTDVDAAELVMAVRMAPLLDGYRGSPRCDVEALKGLLLRVGQLADDNPELLELDLNPVVARDDGVLVLDAKARIAPRSLERDTYSRQLP